jgi:hypothetical protein
VAARRESRREKPARRAVQVATERPWRRAVAAGTRQVESRTAGASKAAEVVVREMAEGENIVIDVCPDY